MGYDKCSDPKWVKNNGHTASRRRCDRLIYALCSMASGAAQFCCSLMAACAAGGAAVSDAKGNTTTTTYDKGRVTKKVFANKGSLLYTYAEWIPYV